MEFASNNVCVRVGGVIMDVWVIIRAWCYYNKKIKNKPFREGDGIGPWVNKGRGGWVSLIQVSCSQECRSRHMNNGGN